MSLDLPHTDELVRSYAANLRFMEGTHGAACAKRHAGSMLRASVIYLEYRLGAADAFELWGYCTSRTSGGRDMNAPPEWTAPRSPIGYGLMSLFEMINCHVSPLCALCSHLMFEHMLRQRISDVPHPDSPMDEEDRQRILGWLKVATQVAEDFEMQAVHDRVDLLTRKLSLPFFSHRDLAHEVKVLDETIDSGLRNQLVYRYSNDNKKLLLDWKTDWSSALSAFSSCEEDVKAAVDCWALGHSTASVFHCMRILEVGLGALAKEFNIIFDIQQWHNVIEQIESAIKDEANALPRGLKKNERLQFTSEAAKEFRYFKDGWRNYVSHRREKYDMHQARSVLEHTRSFMNHLSSELHE